MLMGRWQDDQTRESVGIEIVAKSGQMGERMVGRIVRWPGERGDTGGQCN